MDGMRGGVVPNVAGPNAAGWASAVQIGVGGGAGGGGGHIPQKVPILQVDSSEVEATVLGLCKQGV